MNLAAATPPPWFEELAHRLPSPEPWTLRNESDYYGASRLIADRLGLPDTPPSEANWAHGWYDYPPALVETYTWNCDPQFPAVLTNTEREAKFLRDRGVLRAAAIGASFLYTPEETRPRAPRSLLIVPVHSARETTYQIDDESYFRALDPYLARFDHVAACIHPSCIENGFWLEGLRRRGIPYFFGANVYDAHALRRMRTIFSGFSHVTSNWVGSHIPYSAACGCSVSLFGPRPDFRLADFAGKPFYQKFPQTLRHRFELFENRQTERDYAWLFREPDVTANDRAWALEQLGEANRRPPAEVARLLGWSRSVIAEHFSERASVLGWSFAEDRRCIAEEQNRALWARANALHARCATFKSRLADARAKHGARDETNRQEIHRLVTQLRVERSKSLRQRFFEMARARLFGRPSRRQSK